MVNITQHKMTPAQFQGLEPLEMCAKLGEASKAEMSQLGASMDKTGYNPGSIIYVARTTARGKVRILDGRVRHRVAVEKGLVKDALPNVFLVSGSEPELYRLMVQANAIRRTLPKFMRGIIVVNALADDPDWDVVNMAQKAQVSESLIGRVIATKKAGLDGYVESEEIPLERAYQLTKSHNKDILEALTNGEIDGRTAHVRVKEREDERRADSDAKSSGKTFSLTDKQIADLSKGKLDSDKVHEIMAQAQSAITRARTAERERQEAVTQWHNAMVFNGLLTRAMRVRGLDVDAILAEASDVMEAEGKSMLAEMISDGMGNIPTPPTAEDTETDGAVNNAPTGADTYTDEDEFEKAKKRWNDERHAAKPKGYSELTHAQQKSWRTQYAKENPQPVLAQV